MATRHSIGAVHGPGRLRLAAQRALGRAWCVGDFAGGVQQGRSPSIAAGLHGRLQRGLAFGKGLGQGGGAAAGQ
ncbi:hypothetical protein AAHN93_11840 [Vandammella animalimorsus]|uniref:hypothetical protein n=1 Tax=Vandammella animalimorsus TaxID=2029117 RepID=UPI0031BA8F54